MTLAMARKSGDAAPMGKVIFWLVVIFVAMFALRLYNAAKARERLQAERERAARERRQRVEAMVRCEECGVFLPRTEAISAGAGYRCGSPGCSRRH